MFKHFKKNGNIITKKKQTIVNECLEWLFCIVIAVILALLFRYFVATPTVVKMSSMFPTLKEADRLILNRTIRISKQLPNRGDIITFEAPSKKSYTYSEIAESNLVAKYEREPIDLLGKFTYYVLELKKESYIKRVIALPGEHIEIKEGIVYINGEKLQEDYLQDGIVTDISDTEFNDFIVPDNCVFAMGDNRAHSTDCRDFGCIPLEKIESIVLFRIWPINKFGKII